jgi:magnesium-transporting ATPase (P-type)
MLKEAIADYKRYKQDKKANAMTVRKVTGLEQEHVTIRSDEVKVGDVIEMHDGDTIPADCLLLTTRDQKGDAYIETRSLDGETNMKVKMAIQELNDYFSDRKELDSIGVVQAKCEAPSANLYQFQAQVTWEQDSYDADLKQFLPRGAVVRNSDKITALVLFTSTDCKLVMNQGKYQFKQSQLDRNINYLMAWNIVLLLVIASIMTHNSNQFIRKYRDLAPYMFYGADDTLTMTISVFGSFFLLLNQFVPMELILTLEMVKIFVLIFIENDIHMMYEDPYEPGELQYC